MKLKVTNSLKKRSDIQIGYIFVAFVKGYLIFTEDDAHIYSGR
jgi:hypothetical protein